MFFTSSIPLVLPSRAHLFLPTNPSTSVPWAPPSPVPSKALFLQGLLEVAALWARPWALLCHPHTGPCPAPSPPCRLYAPLRTRQLHICPCVSHRPAGQALSTTITLPEPSPSLSHPTATSRPNSTISVMQPPPHLSAQNLAFYNPPKVGGCAVTTLTARQCQSDPITSDGKGLQCYNIKLESPGFGSGPFIILASSFFCCC